MKGGKSKSPVRGHIKSTSTRDLNLTKKGTPRLSASYDSRAPKPPKEK